MTKNTAVNNDTSIATIKRLSHDGRGIAEIDGKITFLLGGLPEEQVRFQYQRRRPSYDEGIVVEVISSKDNRCKPRCPHFSVCGGCHLQHLAPRKQLEHKQRVLLELLAHQKTPPMQVLPAIEGPAWEYRHKARFSVKYVAKKNKVLIGFHEKNSRYIAEINQCDILPKSVSNLLVPFAACINLMSIRDQIPQIELAVTPEATAIVIRHLAPFTDHDLRLLTAFLETHQLRCYLQPGGPSTIHLFFPESAPLFLNYQLPILDLTFEFAPTQFVQINPAVNQQMVMQALSLLNLKENDVVLDLFCGIGNFSLPIAKYCQQVVGVEGSHDAVNQATHNAALNNITNAEFFTADLEQDMKNVAWASYPFTKILLDPPRSGAKTVIQHLSKWHITHIVYISCNSATFARDAEALVQQGWHLKTVGVMDMFPHTQHIETIALFTHDG